MNNHYVVAGCVLALLALVPAACPAAEPAAKSGKFHVYVGTYTGGKSGSKGVYVMTLDAATGALGKPEVAAEVTSPSFLAVHPSQKFLYAVGEIADFQGKKAGAVSAFSLDRATGRLTLLNQQPSGGAGPAHLSVDPGGKNALVANYGGGSVACLPIGEDGRLREPSDVEQHTGSSVNPQRQKEPHAHCIKPDPAGKFVLTADLGLDKVLVYRFDPAAGKLDPNDPHAGVVAPGSGPRHFAFHPNGKFVYVINEMKSTLTAFTWDADRGAMKEVHTLSTLPEGFTGNNSTAEVVVHPSGKFLYGSNRGHDSIACFSIDESTGRLTATGHESTQGKTPRNFNVDPTGQWLLAANQNSGTVVVFRIDPQSGKLSATGAKAEVPAPVCVKFVPAQ